MSRSFSLSLMENFFVEEELEAPEETEEVRRADTVQATLFDYLKERRSGN